jgi:phosphonate transport system substrate-binding protein
MALPAVDSLGLPIRRRSFARLIAGAGTGLLAAPRALKAETPVTFGLTPVVVTSDFDVLAALATSLQTRLGRPVTLVQRRTYQEITALLLSGQLDAAWICGYPYVQFRDRLALVAVPLYKGQPLYQSYLIRTTDRPARRLEDLRGDIHAFSDPDSNSGHLVTSYKLSLLKETPSSFFRRTFFTYAHRDVIRAVASGLADSGSCDGYVWDVLAETEPGLVEATVVVERSEPLGFPPIACLGSRAGEPTVLAIQQALLTMADDEIGRQALRALRLDGFQRDDGRLFDRIASLYEAVRAQS